MTFKTAVAIAVLVVGASACASNTPEDQVIEDVFPASLAQDPYDPQIDPSRFGGPIDNPFFPLKPGTVFTYEGTEDGETQTGVVTVTDDTKTIMGIEATVVKDEVKLDGELAELTYDWYAQDDDGNVWYMGEDSSDYEDGKKVSSGGSWQAGKDGALPGVIMPGVPQEGMEYRQEYYEDEAVDVGKILKLDGTIKVPHGSFEDVLVTEDRNPLEPDTVENKYYAEGVGLVYEEHVKGDPAKFELISVETDA